MFSILVQGEVRKIPRMTGKYVAENKTQDKPLYRRILS